MNLRALPLAVLLCLSSCAIFDGEEAPPQPTLVEARAVGPLLNPMDPLSWEIGPVIDGERVSSGVPLHPFPHPEGWAIDFPHPTQASGSIHYVTMPVGSLVSISRLRMRYRIEAAPGVRILPRNYPEGTASLTLYLERKDLGWTAAFEDWRWFANSSTQRPLEAGERTVEARLDGGWVGALTSTTETNPFGFVTAIAQAGRVGFVLGGGDGLGHGVYATGPARLVVLEYSLQ